MNGLHLQYEGVSSCCMDQYFAVDLHSSPCQTLLRQATHEKCFIFVHIGLSSFKLWGCNNIEIL